MEFCAYRALLETTNSESTACGPNYDYPGDEDLAKLDYTRDARAYVASFFFFFANKFKF